MKKLFLYSLLITSALFLTACAGNVSDNIDDNLNNQDNLKNNIENDLRKDSDELILREEINFSSNEVLAIAECTFSDEEDILAKYYGEENLEKVKVFGDSYSMSFIFIPKDKDTFVTVWSEDLNDEGELEKGEKIVDSMNSPFVVRVTDFEFITHLHVDSVDKDGNELFSSCITESGMDGHLVFDEEARSFIKDITNYDYEYSYEE